MSKAQPVTKSSTQTQTIDPWLSSAASRVAGLTGSLPGYSAYTGAGPSGLTANQLSALGLAQFSQGQGQAIAGQAYNPLNSLTGFEGKMIDPNSVNASTQAYMNPYISNVVDAYGRAADRNTQGAVDQSDARLAGQHAFGGSRANVASGVIQSQNAIAKSQMTSDLMSKGYSAAQAAAMAEAQANQSATQAAAGTRLGASNALAGLGQTIGGLNTQDIANLSSTGKTAQDTATAQNMFNYQKWINDMTMPGQMLQQQASILGGLPHGGQTTGQETQMSYSNPWAGLAGLGLGLAGMGTGGGATLGGSALSGLFGSLFGPKTG